MAPRASLPLLLAALLGVATASSAQVLRDLDPIRLDYRILAGGGPDSVGTAQVSYEFVDTSRGRRLRVEYAMQYVVGDENPVTYHEEVTLSCDEKGVEKFEGLRRFGDKEETYSAFRSGIDYHITATRGGQTEQFTGTAGVQRSNVGLFCGGFLEEPLDTDSAFRDYPLLFPAEGRHHPRQKFRTGIMPFQAPSGPVPLIVSFLQRIGTKSKDELWHRHDDHQPLVKMVESRETGRTTYELTAVNGEHVDWASAIP